MKKPLELPAGARKAPMPSSIEPMKAELVDEPFSKPGWIFENKWDGVRAITFIKNGKMKLISRNEKDMTLRYPELATLPENVEATDVILDGEIVAINDKGKVDFHLLSSRFGLTNPAEIEQLRKTQRIIYYVFDILYLNGYDLMGSSLLQRKSTLKSAIKQTANFKFTPHVAVDGEKFFKKVEAEHGEGMIAKRAESTYQQRRSKDWLKVKTQMRQEFVIVGYSYPRGSRKYFGALELALYDGKILRSVGQVGTGFSEQTLRELYKMMKPLETKTPPIADDGVRRPDVHWIKPKLVAEVRFSEFTPDLKLRHPAFIGLRDDKGPKDCKFEIPKPTEQVAKKQVAKRQVTPQSALSKLLKR